ncbi:MAG: glutamyl-tRNA reductase [Acidimicrobiaceae bacterium]|nr:glutamyl-tRNA reductase [Acidimicrobiaceae bacterium]
MPLASVSICESDLAGGDFDRFALGADSTRTLYRLLTEEPLVSEAALISTCFRTELYAEVAEFHLGIEKLVDILAEVVQAGRAEVSSMGRVFYGRGVAEHIYRVASGIESRILGETEILGQVKSAMESARAQNISGKTINRLFQNAIEVGKAARSETNISVGATSLPSAAIRLLESHLPMQPETQSLILVGVGQIGSGIADLAVSRFKSVTLVSRSEVSAQALAARLNPAVAVGGNSELMDLLRSADAAIFATASDTEVLDSASVLALSEFRSQSPIVVLDLGVPRNVNAVAQSAEGISLIQLESVNRFLAEESSVRFGAVAEVEKLIEARLEEFALIGASREIGPVLEALYKSAENVRLEELAKFGPKLAGLEDRQKAAVEALTHQIIARLLHEPAVQIRRQAASGNLPRLLEDVKLIFDL